MSEPASTVTTDDLLHGAGVGHWILDPTRSSVDVTHKTMWNLMTVKGHFGSVAGEGDVSADGSVTGRLELAVDSLTTGNGKRDTHLHGADFFDSSTYPKLVFSVSGVTPEGGGVRVAGELTVAGTTRPLQFQAAVTEASASTVALRADLEVDRTDFGMTWNQLGMMKGPAHVLVTATLTRQA